MTESDAGRDSDQGEKTAKLLRAVEVTTSWLWSERDFVARGDDEAPVFIDVVSEELARDPVGLLEGMGALTGLLLMRLATATGQRPEKILGDITARYSSPPIDDAGDGD